MIPGEAESCTEGGRFTSDGSEVGRGDGGGETAHEIEVRKISNNSNSKNYKFTSGL